MYFECELNRSGGVRIGVYAYRVWYRSGYANHSDVETLYRLRIHVADAEEIGVRNDSIAI